MRLPTPQWNGIKLYLRCKTISVEVYWGGGLDGGGDAGDGLEGGDEGGGEGFGGFGCGGGIGGYFGPPQPGRPAP